MTKLTKPPPVRKKPSSSKEARLETESGLNSNFLVKSYNALTGSSWHDVDSSSETGSGFTTYGHLSVGPIGFFAALRRVFRVRRDVADASLGASRTGYKSTSTFAINPVENSEMCQRCYNPQKCFEERKDPSDQPLPSDLRLLSGERGAEYLHSARCISLFTRAFLLFGIPSHRTESMLLSLAKELDVQAHFIQLPGITVISFHTPDTLTTNTQVIKASPILDLGRAHKVHELYRDLMHGRRSSEEICERVEKLLTTKLIYGRKLRCLFAFGCAATICPISFGGSFLDMWLSGILASAMMAMNLLYVRSENHIMASIFELVMAVFVSFVARGLSTIDNGRLFCYQAISSSGVVLILPGFLILLSSLDLANKHFITGSVKLVYTITYTLFLAFCLTFGSDGFLIIRNILAGGQYSAAPLLNTTTTVNGAFHVFSANDSASSILAPDNLTDWSGQFTFTNATSTNFTTTGCLRLPTMPWYTSAIPTWNLFFFVPLFSFFISLHNLQPIRSLEFASMIAISIFSYSANYYATNFISVQSEIVTCIGAFIIGLCGSIYSRIFKGSGLTVSVTGVLFLVPTGLSAAGGLAGNDADYFGTNLRVAGRMLQVSISITIGLLFSMTLVYLFGRKKRGALFAF